MGGIRQWERAGQYDKYESHVDSKDYLVHDGAGPVKVKSTDGQEYIDHKGGINFDVGMIDRTHGMGDARSGKIVVEDMSDGVSTFASGLKRINTTESHQQYLEAQSKYSVKKEYTFNVDLKAAEGASVDAEIEKKRQELAARSRARKAAEKKRIQEENARMKAERELDAVKGEYALIVDDDIMDEEAGRMRLELAHKSRLARQEGQRILKEKAHEERMRIKNTPSKIHSWNDSWNANLAVRHENEHTIAALLEEIRARVGNGEGTTDRQGLHGLEKQLASAQNWIVSPPTANATRWKQASMPPSPLALNESFALVGNLFD